MPHFSGPSGVEVQSGSIPKSLCKRGWGLPVTSFESAELGGKELQGEGMPYLPPPQYHRGLAFPRPTQTLDHLRRRKKASTRERWTIASPVLKWMISEATTKTFRAQTGKRPRHHLAEPASIQDVNGQTRLLFTPVGTRNERESPTVGQRQNGKHREAHWSLHPLKSSAGSPHV